VAAGPRSFGTVHMYGHGVFSTRRATQINPSLHAASFRMVLFEWLCPSGLPGERGGYVLAPGKREALHEIGHPENLDGIAIHENASRFMSLSSEASKLAAEAGQLASEAGRLTPEAGRVPPERHRKNLKPPTPQTGRGRSIARYALAAILISAGVGHLSWARTSFRAQVPGWVPMDPDTVVLLSGMVEIALGAALLRVRSKWTGWIVGAFFVAVFPGNISQFVNHKDAFGLDTDTRRAVRLLFQPVLVAWAIWSTGDRRR
jgi:uncharacterized membrane protein